MAIEIIIKNTDAGMETLGADNPIQKNENTDKDDSKVSGKKDPSKALILNALKTQSIAWAKTSFQSYTKYTGQGMLQNQVESALNIVSDIGTLATGVMVGGTVGVMVAGAVLVSKYGVQQFNQYMDIKTQNRQLSFVRQGQGEIVVNGGRFGA